MMMYNGSDDQWCDDDYTDEVSEFDRLGKIRKNQFHTLSLQHKYFFFSFFEALDFIVGYNEGLSKGQEAAVQEGFTNGFKESVSVGYNWGLVNGLKEKLVEILEVREKFQILYTSINSVSEEDALGLYLVNTTNLLITSTFCAL
ncbi:hypothetical protein MKX03_022014 [Papaver bracteatum]|nr:hypothetical protein MKX03_022014 [Papaver bracteatum]